MLFNLMTFLSTGSKSHLSVLSHAVQGVFIGVNLGFLTPAKHFHQIYSRLNVYKIYETPP